MRDTPDLDKARAEMRELHAHLGCYACKISNYCDDADQLTAWGIRQRAEEAERCAMDIDDTKLEPHTPDTQRLSIQLEAVCRNRAADLRRQAAEGGK